ncbi:MAG: enoyl-CoA hydratase/isomerase family protein [Candidatus Binatia bacterium]
MTYTTLGIERDRSIVRIWLDRPAKRNALDATALEEIAAVCAELQTAHDVHVVVIGGRGVSFCAGADRKNPPARLARGSGASARERRWAAEVGRRAVQAVERLEAITIARLHGHVIGGGVLLAIACDFRIAAAGTAFHVPEVDLGIPLTWGGVPRLIRAVGEVRAKEIILLCERFDAAEAAAMGLVNRVVAPDTLDEVVDDWARRLAEKPPWAAHMTKTQFRAYAHAAVLGDLTAHDGALLIAATEEDPTRFGWPGKR